MQGFRVALQLILFLLSVWGPGGAGVVLIDHKGFLIPTIVLMIAALRTMRISIPLSGIAKILLYAFALGMGLWGFAPVLHNEIFSVVGLAVASVGMIIGGWALGIHTLFMKKEL